MKKANGTFLVILLCGFLLSCTREVDTTAAIQLNFNSLEGVSSSPQATSVPAGYYPSHIVANIHYDGRTAVSVWDCHQEGNQVSNCSLPPALDFEGRTFPNGRGRIVQVLLVYANSANQLIFYYDHALDQTFNGQVKTIALNNWQGAGVSQGTGKVAGRLIDGANFPSGRAVAYYEPVRPAGMTAAQIPAMEIEDSLVAAGWFNFMFLQNVKFTYKLFPANTANPVITIFDSKTLNDFSSTITGASAATIVTSPAFYNVYPYDFTSTPNQFRSHLNAGETYVLGFFNLTTDGSISFKLASNGFGFNIPSSGVVREAYLSPFANCNPIFQGDGFWADPTSSGSCIAAPTAANSNGNQVLWLNSYKLSWVGPTGDSTHAGSVAGLRATTSGSAGSADCTGMSSNVTATCMQAFINGVGHEGVQPFRGPFQYLLDSNSNDVILKIDPLTANSYNVTWSYLPGVLGTSASAAPLQGTGVYLAARSYADNSKDGVDCNAMISTQNAVWVNDIDSANAPNNEAPVDATAIALADARFGASQYVAVACPYSEKLGVRKYYRGALGYGFYPVSTGAIKLKLAMLPGVLGFNKGACLPLVAKSLDMSNNLAPIQGGPYALPLTTDVSAAQFYADNKCSGAAITQINATANQILDQTVYVKTVSSTGSSGNFTLASGSSGLAPGNLVSVPYTGITSTLGNIVLTGPSSVYINNCTNLKGVAVDSSSYAIAVVSTATINAASHAGSATVNFYSNNSCTSSLSGSPVYLYTPSSDTNFDLFIQPSGMGNINNINILGYSSTAYTATVNAAGIPAGTGLNIAAPSILRTGFCYPAQVLLKDSNMNTAINSFGLSLNFSLSGSGLAFYSDTMCASSLASTIVAPGAYSSNIYVRFTNPTANLQVINTQSYLSSYNPPQFTVNSTNMQFAGGFAPISPVNITAQLFDQSFTTLPGTEVVGNISVSLTIVNMGAQQASFVSTPVITSGMVNFSPGMSLSMVPVYQTNSGNYNYTLNGGGSPGISVMQSAPISGTK